MPSYEPRIGDWYSNQQKQTFEVVAFDPEEGGIFRKLMREKKSIIGKIGVVGRDVWISDELDIIQVK